MAIALRLNFVDVVCDDSLKHIYANGKKVGYQFDVRLSYYRGHFLSVIDEVGVTVDGEEIAPENITFSIKGQDYALSQLHDLTTVFWPIIEPATIKIFKDGGIEGGEHNIDFKLFFRSPYMPIGENEYMPIDSCGQKTLTVLDF